MFQTVNSVGRVAKHRFPEHTSRFPGLLDCCGGFLNVLGGSVKMGINKRSWQLSDRKIHHESTNRCKRLEGESAAKSFTTANFRRDRPSTSTSELYRSLQSLYYSQGNQGYLR